LLVGVLKRYGVMCYSIDEVIAELHKILWNGIFLIQ
jgi:hypothetical protein